jgi:NAD-dependent dihydropyrimidine dehydrogenase PreA subunit
MAYKISPDKCIACGSCAAECPASAIKPGAPYRIEPEECLDCGSCETACPEGAISPG